MINGKKVIVIVPARGGSKGLPGKNMLPLCGKPLVAWPIAAATSCKLVDKVIVSTDDKEIAACAAEHGAEIPFLRPTVLATDEASSNDVVLHALRFLEARGEAFDIIVLLEPTSPLTEARDLESALEMLESHSALADAIVSVSRMEAFHPDYTMRITEVGLLRAYDNASKKPSRRQEIEPLYFLDGSLYISSVTAFYQYQTFYHQRTMPFVTPKWKSLEIDDFIDFICVEAILKHKEKLQNEVRN
ncbi:cytidylyltransferase domain-containing protein [Paenibacillus rigui]|uniref:Acylneuraminate cytidylyltransferase n=1 Tax=Paenibacillus rigui TaxID=554312 RepID=A0A229UI45_9BACL|nr:acylneuraminate cytidylyltransferase family protein [Paenibacillus rigui]OXM83050.1 acylneuraminate cytidylyltransferase [Paenibacillus rigui]